MLMLLTWDYIKSGRAQNTTESVFKISTRFSLYICLRISLYMGTNLEKVLSHAVSNVLLCGVQEHWEILSIFGLGIFLMVLN